LFLKEEMTTEQEILSFQKKLEERNFVFNDRLLEQLFKEKMERLHRQTELNQELRRLAKRR
jgi:heme oxygenase